MLLKLMAPLTRRFSAADFFWLCLILAAVGVSVWQAWNPHHEEQTPDDPAFLEVRTGNDLIVDLTDRTATVEIVAMLVDDFAAEKKRPVEIHLGEGDLDSAAVAQLARVTSLRVVNLGDAGPLDYDAFVALASLPELIDLRAKHGAPSDAAIAAIVEHAPQVQRLVLDAQQLSVAALERLAELTKLQSLILHHGRFSPDAWLLLADYPALESLYLFDCNVEEDAYDALERAIGHIHAP